MGKKARDQSEQERERETEPVSKKKGEAALARGAN